MRLRGDVERRFQKMTGRFVVVGSGRWKRGWVVVSRRRGWGRIPWGFLRDAAGGEVVG